MFGFSRPDRSKDDPRRRWWPVALIVVVLIGMGLVALTGDEWRAEVAAFLRQLARSI